MQKKQYSIFRYLLYGSLSIFVLCIVLILGYSLVQSAEQSSCYRKIASKYNVAPTYYAIGNELLKQINQQVVVGMNKDEVMKSINIVAPASEVQGGFSGNRIEVRLDVCKITANDIFYLIRFKEGKFIDIVLYTIG